MTRFFLLMSLIIAVVVGYAQQNSSTIAPEFTIAKKQSFNAIRQDVGETLGAIIRECAVVIADVNALQQCCMDNLSNLMEQSSESLLVKADKKKLSEYQSQFTNVLQQLHTVAANVKKSFTDIKSKLQ